MPVDFGSLVAPHEAALVKRSVEIWGRETSFALERPFWDGLKLIASEHRLNLQETIEQVIPQGAKLKNRAAVLRVFVLKYFMQRL